MVYFIEPALTFLEALCDGFFEALECPRREFLVAAETEEEKVVGISGDYLALMEPRFEVLEEFLVRLAFLLLELVCCCVRSSGEVVDFHRAEDWLAVHLDALQILLEILLNFCRFHIVLFLTAYKLSNTKKKI